MKYGFEVYQAKDDERLYWIAQSKAYIKNNGEYQYCFGEGNTINEAINNLDMKESEWIKKAEYCKFNIVSNKPRIVVSKKNQDTKKAAALSGLSLYFFVSFIMHFLIGKPSLIGIFSDMAILTVTLLLIKIIDGKYTSTGYKTKLEKYLESK